MHAISGITFEKNKYPSSTSLQVSKLNGISADRDKTKNLLNEYVYEFVKPE
jgi:hypothetical protein